MAYNEAEWITRHVKSALRVADICTVFDNGSSDGTTDLARKAGAEVVNLPAQEGDDYNDVRFNHRERRNECLSRLRGDWILNLDADETFCGGHHGTLRWYINSYPKHDAFAFYRYDLWCSENHYRKDWFNTFPWLWHNNIGIRYGVDNPPHEELVFAGGRAIALDAVIVPATEAWLSHYHYVRGWKAERHLKTTGEQIEAVRMCYEAGGSDDNVIHVPWA